MSTQKRDEGEQKLRNVAPQDQGRQESFHGSGLLLGRVCLARLVYLVPRNGFLWAPANPLLAFAGGIRRGGGPARILAESPNLSSP